VRKLFIFVIVFFSFFNKSFASGLDALKGRNVLEIVCNIAGSSREFIIYPTEIISLDDLWKYEIVKQEKDIIVGTRTNNKYIKDFIIIDKKNSSITIGEYKKNLKNENEVSTSSVGFCNRKLD
jgi:hypothetical protein